MFNDSSNVSRKLGSESGEEIERRNVRILEFYGCCIIMAILLLARQNSRSLESRKAKAAFCAV